MWVDPIDITRTLRDPAVFNLEVRVDILVLVDSTKVHREGFKATDHSKAGFKLVQTKAVMAVAWVLVFRSPQEMILKHAKLIKSNEPYRILRNKKTERGYATRTLSVKRKARLEAEVIRSVVSMENLVPCPT